MRLIDADILLGYVQKYDKGQPIGKALRAMLEKSPTVDAAPVIRCKDCRRWNTKDGMFKDFDERQWHECPYLGVPTDEWFFCRDAERRQE